MEVIAMLARLSMCVVLLLCFWHGTQGARMLGADSHPAPFGVYASTHPVAASSKRSAHVQQWPEPLPLCKDVPGGIQNWDCYDPPSTPLPPCDYKHQNPGIDCRTDPPASKVTQLLDDHAQSSVHHAQGMLPPCKDVPGGIQNWDCYDPHSTPLPPCDFKHQNPGTDCSMDPHPAPAGVFASTHPAASSGKRGAHAQQWPEPLPPCKDVPGGMQNWDCYDPPSTPLPPCDYKHQNPGIDCRTDPPASKVTQLMDNYSQSSVHHAQGMLPPCKDVPGGIQNWDCYDPPQTPLPPCDFKHQNPGIDCRVNPPASKVTQKTHDSAQSGGVYGEQGMLPPCIFPGAIPGWNCFDPPQTPLPPCDFKHHRPGFDCWPRIPRSPPVASP